MYLRSKTKIFIYIFWNQILPKNNNNRICSFNTTIRFIRIILLCILRHVKVNRDLTYEKHYQSGCTDIRKVLQRFQRGFPLLYLIFRISWLICNFQGFRPLKARIKVPKSQDFQDIVRCWKGKCINSAWDVYINHNFGWIIKKFLLLLLLTQKTRFLVLSSPGGWPPDAAATWAILLPVSLGVIDSSRGDLTWTWRFACSKSPGQKSKFKFLIFLG